jgi:Holliday junction resolvase RusA-like endonuclease
MITLTYPFRLISKDNEKVFNRQGRCFLSRRFKDFEKVVRDYTAMQYKGKALDCNIAVDIYAYFENKKHCDCFNLPKGVMDALQGIVFKNDRQIKRGNVEVFEDCPNDCFKIVINAIIP